MPTRCHSPTPTEVRQVYEAHFLAAGEPFCDPYAWELLKAFTGTSPTLCRATCWRLQQRSAETLAWGVTWQHTAAQTYATAAALSRQVSSGVLTDAVSCTAWGAGGSASFFLTLRRSAALMLTLLPAAP